MSKHNKNKDRKSKGNKGVNRAHKCEREVREVKLQELKAIIERAKSLLSEQDVEQLQAAVDTLAFLTQELEKKGVSIQRLRQLIFGVSSEKTRDVFKEDKEEKQESESSAGDNDNTEQQSERGEQEKPKRKGHGRRGAEQYRGAQKVKVAHQELKSGDICPACERGKLYQQSEPAKLIRITGMAPLAALIYELERLRCNACGQVFTAQAPHGVGEQKYDESATAMIGLLKYATGMPFNRLQRLQDSLGIPLPAGTQWQLVSEGAQAVEPAYKHLVYVAANSEILYNDDTTMRILELAGTRDKTSHDTDDEEQRRTGVFTTGIVADGQGHRIALFLTGQKHAGENLASVLAKRAKELTAPIQMCDMLSRNSPKDFQTILAGCNAHARRRYVEVANSFPEQVRHVLEQLKIVYENDAIAKAQNMSNQQRLTLHQNHSGLVMENLKTWLKEQIEQKKVEPNSSLGDAIGFMLKHWDRLTLFLQVPGAPLDNNIVERALKMAIRHRKNAMFYKTENGARVGDMFMTLIYTAELNGIDPFDYLVSLLRYPKQVASNPAEWMPWNYQQTMARLTLAQASPLPIHEPLQTAATS